MATDNPIEPSAKPIKQRTPKKYPQKKHSHLKIVTVAHKHLKNRTEMITRIPIKDGEMITTLSMPETQMVVRKMTLERNPNKILLFEFNGLKFNWYTDTKKGFVFDKEDNYVGHFEKHDLKWLYHKSGIALRNMKKRHGL